MMNRIRRTLLAAVAGFATATCSSDLPPTPFVLGIEDFKTPSFQINVVSQWCAETAAVTHTFDATIKVLKIGDPASEVQRQGVIYFQSYTVSFVTKDQSILQSGVTIPSETFAMKNTMSFDGDLKLSEYTLVSHEQKTRHYQNVIDVIGPEAWFLDSELKPSTDIDQIVADGSYEAPLWEVTIHFDAESDTGEDMSFDHTETYEIGAFLCK